MAIDTNNTDYRLVSDREMSIVLDYFTADMVIDVVQDVLEDRTRPYSYNIANIVGSYETNYKIAVSQYPEYAEELQNKRQETYESIMNCICSYHDIGYSLEPTTDLFTAAFYTYQFLVSDFKKNVATFYTNYILREKNNIYDALSLGEMKKNKDSSSIYSRKVYKNTSNKIPTIHANLSLVLDELAGFDIDLNIILEFVYMQNKQVGIFLQSILYDNGDFYHNYFRNIINSTERPEVITNIRLQLQPVPVEVQDFLI